MLEGRFGLVLQRFDGPTLLAKTASVMCASCQPSRREPADFEQLHHLTGRPGVDA